eukprot:314611_1
MAYNTKIHCYWLSSRCHTRGYQKIHPRSLYSALDFGMKDEPEEKEHREHVQYSNEANHVREETHNACTVRYMVVVVVNTYTTSDVIERIRVSFLAYIVSTYCMKIWRIQCVIRM